MAAPVFHIGQQVVVKNKVNGNYVASVVSASVVAGKWKYGVKINPTVDAPAFVHEEEVSHLLVDGKWQSTDRSVQFMS